MTKNDLTIVELFSGTGGLGLGFHLEGFKTLVAYEYEDDCVSTYKSNFPETKVIKKDLYNFDDEDIKDLKKYLLESTGKDGIDIVMGGPPCRSFSTANPKKKENDERDFLYRTLIKVANALGARYFLMENVADLNSKNSHETHDKKIFHELLEDLMNVGFKYINFDILNSADYGVPQTRERLIILATKEKDLPLVFPKPFYFKDKQPQFVTVEKAFDDLPEVTATKDTKTGKHQNYVKTENGEVVCSKYAKTPSNNFSKYCRSQDNTYGYYKLPWIDDKVAKRLTLFILPGHTPRIIERYSLLQEDENQGDLKKRLKEELSVEAYTELEIRKVLPKGTFIQKNRKLPLHKPSRTITSHVREELVHPKFDRNLTAREAARLQSFPDWYTFKGVNQKPYKGTEFDIGNGRDYYQQIGDAVPPLLSGAIAHQVKQNLLNKEPTKNPELREKILCDIVKRRLTIQEVKKEKIKNISYSNILTGLTEIDESGQA